MNSNKLQNYILTASIHTMAIKSPGLLDNVKDTLILKCITSSSQNQNGSRTTTSIINPNKLAGDLFRYSDFTAALDKIVAGAGINDEYKLLRVDMRFDSYDAQHYRLYAKLNRYLISALAVTYNVQNCYKTVNLFSEQQLSVAIKNKYFEVENYDKAAESAGTDIAMSRLEERSKSWQDNDIRREFIDHWFRRWDKAAEHLQDVQNRYNAELAKLYFEDTGVRHFLNAREFITRYQDCIFCKAQMIDLCGRIGISGDPQNYAENYKKRYGIEYFSQKDVKAAIDEIKRATLQFFDS